MNNKRKLLIFIRNRKKFAERKLLKDQEACWKELSTVKTVFPELDIIKIPISAKPRKIKLRWNATEDRTGKYIIKKMTEAEIIWDRLKNGIPSPTSDEIIIKNCSKQIRDEIDQSIIDELSEMIKKDDELSEMIKKDDE